MTPGDNLDPVRDYYQVRGESELHRLDNPYEGVVERELHGRALAELLPPGGRVLDLGGGPGHWTAWLLERGHRVVLADLSPRMLEIGRRELGRQGLDPEAIVECDARDLAGFADASFDAVVAMGPFYHLVHAPDRDRARDEAVRVLRPGGTLLATVMMRHSWMLTTLLAGELPAPDLPPLLESGVYRATRPGPLTEAYLFRAEEVTTFFEASGLVTRRLMASQGILNQVQEQVAELRERDQTAFLTLIEAAYATSQDPSIMGLSGHLLYAGMKPPEEA